MYEELPLEALEPNPANPNRISRMFAKKLRHNIEQLGMYETLTVRPHPSTKGKFEVLNGHARLEVLNELGIFPFVLYISLFLMAIKVIKIPISDYYLFFAD